MKDLFILASVTVFLFFAAPIHGQTSQKILDINKKVVGKWLSSDRKSYIEFLPDGVCSEGEFYEGTWHVEEGKLGAWEKGKEFSCLSGILTLVAPNTLTRDIGMGGAMPTKYYRGVQQPKPVSVPAACTFCGVWEYDGAQHYLKISQGGGGKFKLLTGFIDLAGEIEWTEPEIKNANGIYLRMVGGKLIGEFVSPDFLPTHSHYFTYRITCSLRSDNKMGYLVWASNGSTQKFVATKISD